MVMTARCRRRQPARGPADYLYLLLLTLIIVVVTVAAAASATTLALPAAAIRPSAEALLGTSSPESPAEATTYSSLASQDSPPPSASAASTASPSPDAWPNLTAYDCAHPDTKRAVVDLVTLPECAPPAELVQRQVKARVLLTREFHMVHVYTCRVDVTADLEPCSQYSIWDSKSDRFLQTNLTSPTTLHSTQILGRGACKKLHQGQPYTKDAKDEDDAYSPYIDSYDSSFSIVTQANSTSTESRNSTGCLAVYHDGQNQAYAVVSVKMTVKISLSDFWVTEERDSSSVALPSGKTCVYEEAYCAGVPEGEALWDPVPNDCQGGQHHLDVRYEGAAVIVNHPWDNTEHVVFIDGSRNKTISYRLGNRTEICNDEAYPGEGDNIEPARVTVVLKPPGQNFSFESSSLPSAETRTELPTGVGKYSSQDNWFKLNYHLNLKHQMQTQAHATCLEDRRQLRVKLEVARASADPVAALAVAGILDKDVRGLQGVVVGGVLHLKQCVPVAVRLRAAPRCYQEVPVTVVAGGAAAFMTASRDLLVFDGQEVPCDPLAPPMHRLAGEWYAFEPTPRRLAASGGTALPAAVGSAGRATPVFAAAAPRQQGSEATVPLPSSPSADVFECTALRGSLLSGMAVRATQSGVAGADRAAQTWRVFSEGDWAAIADKTGLRCFATGVSAVLVVIVVVVAAKAAAQAWACRRLRLVDDGSPWRLSALSALSPGLLVARLLAVEPRGAAGEANGLLVELQARGEQGSLDTLRSRLYLDLQPKS